MTRVVSAGSRLLKNLRNAAHWPVDPGRGSADWRKRRLPCRNGLPGAGVAGAGVARASCCSGACRLGQDLCQQAGRGFRCLALQHAQPRRTASRLGQFARTLHATCNVPIERALLGLAQHAIDSLGKHRLTDGAGCRPLLELFELAHVCHLHHLPFYTFQKPCKFTSSAADPALHGALRNS